MHLRDGGMETREETIFGYGMAGKKTDLMEVLIFAEDLGLLELSVILNK